MLSRQAPKRQGRAPMEELGPLFVPPHDPDRFWILVLLFALPAVGAALIALVRGRLPDALSSYAFLLVPVFAYVLGDIHVLQESKKVEFCGSCHTTMSPVVAAMKGDSDTLSAIHYRSGAVPHDEACYTCHSGYGIWGGVSAKRAGITHMLHTVTGGFDYPLELAGSFDIQACLNCHAEATPFRSVADHQDAELQAALLSREMTCTDCHPSAHPSHALNGVAAQARKSDDSANGEAAGGAASGADKMASETGGGQS